MQLLEYSQAQSESSTLGYPKETQGDARHRIAGVLQNLS
jgi:hypothetical protein